MAVDPENPADQSGRVSLLGAAACLGVSPSSLRHHLLGAGHTLTVIEGRAYLNISVDQAAELLEHKQRTRQQIEELPGWSAAEVARRLDIRQDTVYRLRQLGYLPGYEVRAPGMRKWRWDPETVRAYAQRVGRTLAEEVPAR